MEWVKHFCLFAVSFGVVFCTVCYVNAEAVSFATNPLWLSHAHINEGQTVEVSTVVMKKDAESARGTVSFFADQQLVGTSDFSLSPSVGGAVIAVSFVPSKGTHTISAKISTVTIAQGGKEQTLAVSEEIKSTEKLIVDPDNDRDGIPDASDPDDDNDGVSDVDEKKNGTDPYKKETPVASSSLASVAGAATSSGDYVGAATAIAQSTGSSVFRTTETLREKGKTYFDEALKKNGTVAGFGSTSNAELLNNPSGFLGTLKHYALLAGSSVFGNIYAFYIILIVLVLWIIRKIWRRYSLD